MATLLRLSAVLTVVACLLPACSSSADSGPLALGELYQGYEDTSGGSTPASTYYFKFVDDDTVLNTQSDQTPAQVRAWFNRGQPNVNSDDYDLEGNMVTINYGLASTFRGTIDGERILFHVTLADGSTYERNVALVK